MYGVYTFVFFTVAVFLPIVPPDQQRLIFDRRLKTVAHSATATFRRTSTLHLVLRLRGGMQIFVKTLTGHRPSPVDVETSDTIALKNTHTRQEGHSIGPATVVIAGRRAAAVAAEAQFKAP